MWNLKYDTNTYSKKQKQTPHNREQTGSCQWWDGGVEEGRIRSMGLADINYNI